MDLGIIAPIDICQTTSGSLASEMDEAFLMRLCYLFIAAIDADYDKLEIKMQLSFEINEYFIRSMPQA